MGHGHVVPNPDGSRARCGGPMMCADCALEQARQMAPRPAQVDRLRAEYLAHRLAQVADSVCAASPLSAGWCMEAADLLSAVAPLLPDAPQVPTSIEEPS